MAVQSEAVRVVVRCRPLSSQELSDKRESVVSLNQTDRTVLIWKPKEEAQGKEFTFDCVFGPSVDQAEIYKSTASEIVSRVIEGFNGTIFAYGQTGAGKTHTMSGDENARGIIPRAFEQIFGAIEKKSASSEYLIQVSFLEIYNEEIRDLLLVRPSSSTSGVQKLELQDKPDGSVGVKNLTMKNVTSVSEISALLASGMRNRSVGSTLMNSESSRSHSIFTVVIESSSAKGHVKVGKLNLVDLAGSERQSKTGATGDTLKEASKINLSLSALGNVISALVDGSGFVPYRDSKLTRLLQDSLGGNTKTVMISNIGPADYNYEESLSSLRYASRAKNIKNKPRVNEDPKDALIRSFKEEIDRLKSELSRSQQPPEQVGLIQAKITDMETQLVHGHLEATKAELVKTIQAEALLRKEVEEQAEERMWLEEKFATQSDQVEDLRRKLEKLMSKYRRCRQDLSEAEAEFQVERNDLLSTIRELQKISKLNQLVIDTGISPETLENIETHCMYDEDRDEWVLDDDFIMLEKSESHEKKNSQISVIPPEISFDLLLDKGWDDRALNHDVAQTIYFKIQSVSGVLAREYNPSFPVEPVPNFVESKKLVPNRPATADRHGRRRPESRPSSSQMGSVLSPLLLPETPLPRAKGVVKPMIN